VSEREKERESDKEWVFSLGRICCYVILANKAFFFLLRLNVRCCWGCEPGWQDECVCVGEELWRSGFLRWLLA